MTEEENKEGEFKRKGKKGWKGAALLKSVYLSSGDNTHAAWCEKNCNSSHPSGSSVCVHVMCQESGPAEVIESEHENSGATDSGRGGQAQLEKQQLPLISN